MQLNIVGDALRMAVRKTCNEFFRGLKHPDVIVTITSVDGGLLLQAATFPEIKLFDEMFVPLGQLYVLLLVFKERVEGDSLTFICEEVPSDGNRREYTWYWFAGLPEKYLNRLAPRVHFVPTIT